MSSGCVYKSQSLSKVANEKSIRESLRKKDGTEYKRSSYLAARGAVQRELNRLERNINIQSPAFARANILRRFDNSRH